MTPQKKRSIVFLTNSWTNIDDRIRQGKRPGGTASIVRIWEGCLKQGFDVHVFVMANLERDWPKESVELGGVKCHWVGRPLPRLAAWFEAIGVSGALSPCWFLSFVKMLYRVLESGVRPDVVYSMRRSHWQVGWIVSRLRGARLVLRVYGSWVYHLWFEQKKWLPRIRQLGALLAFLLPRDLLIMTNDGTSGDKAARWLGCDMRKFRFWLNGVDKSMRIRDFDAREFKRGIGVDPDAPMLLSVGRLDAWKRVDRLIDAMPPIVAEFPAARLFVVGGGPSRAALEDRARQLGLSEVITFVGPVGHARIREFLNATDLYLQAYDVSNLSSTLIEALSAGCCIVTRDVGATTTLVTDGENAIVLKPGGAEQYAEAAIRLLRDPAERQRLAEGAYTFAMQSFQTWDERIDMEVGELRGLMVGPR